jgi:hypothetical protein
VLIHDHCLQAQETEFNRCLAVAQTFDCDDLVREYIDACEDEPFYGSTMYATGYAACGLVCMLPWSWEPEPPALAAIRP